MAVTGTTREAPLLRARVGTAALALWAAGGLFFVALAALHIWMALRMQGPWVFSDEAGYLLSSRFLAGRGALPDMGFASLIRPGYALALIPVQLFARSPEETYRAALVLNGLLAASVFPMGFAISRRVFGLPAGTALLVAGAVALYPALVVNSNVVWAESLFVALFFGLTLAFLNLMVRRGTGAGLLVGVAGGALYATHARAAGIVVLLFGVFAVMGLRRSLPRLGAAAGALALAATTLGAEALTRHLDRVLWSRAAGASELRFVKGILRPEVLGDILLSGAGQLWYLTVATAGLAPLGVVFLIRLWRKRGDDTSGGATALFILAAAAAIFAVSSITAFRPQTPGLFRADHVIYGRYNEGFVPLAAMAGLAFLFTKGPVLAALVAALAPSAGAGVAVAAMRAQALDRPFLDLNIPGIAALATEVGGIRIAVVSAAAAGLLAVLLAMRRVPAAAAACLAAVFAAAGLGAFDAGVLPQSRRVNSLIQLPYSMELFERPGAIAYDLSSEAEQVQASTYNAFYGYQFWMPSTRLVRFSAAAGDPPEELAIAPKDWAGPRSGDARMAFSEPDIDRALWVLPGETQRRLEARGLLLPAGAASRLPEEAAVANLSARALRGGPGGMSFEVLATHLGAKSPWAGKWNLGRERGAVRLMAVWRSGDREHRSVHDLPGFVYPGQTVRIHIAVPPAEAPPPGAYKVEVMLFQEGFGPFPPTPGSRAAFDVDVGGPSH